MESARVNWDRLRQLAVDRTPVVGKVILRQPYGVFVDAGLGVGALLLVTRFARTDPPARADGFVGYPQVGDRITARVLIVSEGANQVALTQLEEDD